MTTSRAAEASINTTDAGWPHLDPGPAPWGYETTKRAIDLLGAALGLVLTAPLFAVVAVLIKATSRGPVLFRQERVGRGGRTFTCLKFRTMHRDADDRVHRQYVTHLLVDAQPREGGRPGVYKLAEDDRVTRVGRWLRRTSIDELPQLINVLSGDMSLVGPRPMIPWETELLEPWHRLRFCVKPGLTGLWQVSGRSRLDYRSALRLDVEYVQRRSLRLDLQILARTPAAVVDLDQAA